MYSNNEFFRTDSILFLFHHSCRPYLYNHTDHKTENANQTYRIIALLIINLQSCLVKQTVRASLRRRWQRWSVKWLRSTHLSRRAGSTCLERRLPRRLSALRHLPLSTADRRPDVRTGRRDMSPGCTHCMTGRRSPAVMISSASPACVRTSNHRGKSSTTDE